MRRSPKQAPRGVVLIAVLVVISMIALTAYTFTHWVTLESETAALESRRVQARLAAESAVTLVDALVTLQRDGARVPDLHDNAALLANLELRAKASANEAVAEMDDTARFAVIDPLRPAEREPIAVSQAVHLSYGLQREGGKIHLNQWFAWNPGALQQALLQLPGATEEIVDAVLDWLDADDEKRPNGAEANDYAELASPHAIRNGPIPSLEELLLVKGVTRELLYGVDRNRNGRLDRSESSTEPMTTTMTPGIESLHGWSAYLTVESRERNVDLRGRPRIHLNDSDLSRLYGQVREAFGEELARTVAAYRLLGQGGAAATFRSPLDLVDLVVTGTWDEKPVHIASPIRSDDGSLREHLPRLLDRLTVRSEAEFIGRLDLLSATPESLSLLSMLPESKRLAILEKRPALGGKAVEGNAGVASSESAIPPAATLAWLLLDDILTREEFVAVEPYVTAASPVVRLQSVGIVEPSQLATRWEWVLDTSQDPVAVLSRRRLDRWGLPWRATDLGLVGEAPPLPHVRRRPPGSTPIP